MASESSGLKLVVEGAENNMETLSFTMIFIACSIRFSYITGECVSKNLAREI